MHNPNISRKILDEKAIFETEIEIARFSHNTNLHIELKCTKYTGTCDLVRLADCMVLNGPATCVVIPRSFMGEYPRYINDKRVSIQRSLCIGDALLVWNFLTFLQLVLTSSRVSRRVLILSCKPYNKYKLIFRQVPIQLNTITGTV